MGDWRYTSKQECRQDACKVAHITTMSSDRIFLMINDGQDKNTAVICHAVMTETHLSPLNNFQTNIKQKLAKWKQPLLLFYITLPGS
jgi:hypothetical protein